MHLLTPLINRTLADLLLLMDEYRPIIPDSVTQYYLQRSGFDTSDVRISRLIALSAQKFVSDIIGDAFQYARTRTAASTHGGEENRRRDRARTVLTMDDLAPALAEYGVNVGRQAYYL
ncbi:hypothetical protein BT69DRAFT_1216139 [Atractiella rhizophila]|nr:hypothetical protein BT69DRAFT_1216139 [Atractiella rhizophila]